MVYVYASQLIVEEDVFMFVIYGLIIFCHYVGNVYNISNTIQ